jgi:hypothetical protein
MLKLSILGALAVSLTTISVGCSPKAGPATDAKPKGDKTVAQTSPPPKADAGVTEEEAKAKLTAVLKSWSFGDTTEQFEKANPGIQVFEPTWSIGQISGVKLVRYEIRGGRRSAEKLAPAALGVIEYRVALEFQNRPEGASITRTYGVQKNKDGSWVVSADKD